MKPKFLYGSFGALGAGICVFLLGMPSPVSAAPAALADGWQNQYTAYTNVGPAPDYRGVPVLAYVSGGGAKTILKPNQIGVFPRVFVGNAETVQIVLVFPQGAAGDKIRLTALDGGSLDGGQVGETYTLDDDLKAVVSFKVSANDGASRVSVDIGGQSLGLDFWAGTRPHYRQISAHAKY